MPSGIIMVMDAEAGVMDIGRALSKQYNREQIVFPRKNALSNFKSFDRLTCVGHAHARTYGEDNFTAADFADFLIDECHLPRTVDTIDLIGCELGFTKYGTKYVTEFAARLYARGYDIDVKTFTDLGKHTQYQEMSVAILGERASVKGVPYHNVKMFNSLESKIQKLKEELALLGETLYLTKDPDQKHELGLLYENNVQKVKNLITEQNSFAEEIFLTHNMRDALDKTPDFNFNTKLAHDELTIILDNAELRGLLIQLELQNQYMASYQSDPSAFSSSQVVEIENNIERIQSQVDNVMTIMQPALYDLDQKRKLITIIDKAIKKAQTHSKFVQGESTSETHVANHLKQLKQEILYEKNMSWREGLALYINQDNLQRDFAVKIVNDRISELKQESETKWGKLHNPTGKMEKIKLLEKLSQAMAESNSDWHALILEAQDDKKITEGMLHRTKDMLSKIYDMTTGVPVQELQQFLQNDEQSQEQHSKVNG